MSSTLEITDNLDEKCYSLRDMLTLATAARAAGARDPLRLVEDRLLELACVGL